MNNYENKKEYQENNLNSRNKNINEELIVERPHTCPVVYLQNFSHLSSKYVKKSSKFTKQTFRKPKRNEYLIYAHDKIKNKPIFKTSLKNIGVRKLFYSNEIEEYLSDIESQVSIEFRNIREIIDIVFIKTLPIFKFIMSQLVRTPKFQQKIKKDLIYLKEMPDKEFNESIMNVYIVQKPAEVTKNYIKKIHEQMIKNNTLEKIFNWSQLTLATNRTNIPFITSDSPVVYNNAEFLNSYLFQQDRIEPTLIFNKNTTFYFPIDPQFAILIHNFNNQRKEPLIHYEDIFEDNKIMIFNMLIYQNAEKLVLMKIKDEKLIQNIRKMCGKNIDKDYQSLEFSYTSMKNWIKNREIS